MIHYIVLNLSIRNHELLVGADVVLNWDLLSNLPNISQETMLSLQFESIFLQGIGKRNFFMEVLYLQNRRNILEFMYIYLYYINIGWGGDQYQDLLAEAVDIVRPQSQSTI